MSEPVEQLRAELAALRTRVERQESIEEIRALAERYARAMDMRDFDAGIALFTHDTPVGPGVRGPAALRAVWEQVLGPHVGPTIHFIGNHLVELDPEDPDRATGAVYCRAEHEVGEQWFVVACHYTDTYRRDDGVWRFYRRRIGIWHAMDVLERPTGPDKVRGQLAPGAFALVQDLPDFWPTWGRYQAAAGGREQPPEA
jgi:ketosteroid isomerase-like protein